MPKLLVATIELGMSTWRIARKSFTTFDAEGRRIEVRGAWANPRFSVALSLLELADPPQVDIDGAYLPGADQEARTSPWSNAQVELSRMEESTTWDDRDVLFRGRVTDAQVRPGNLVALSASVNVKPPERMVGTYLVTAERWPNAPESLLGATVPIPFGKPGRYFRWDGTGIIAEGSPAVMVNFSTKRWAVSAELVQGGFVSLMDPDDPTNTQLEEVSYETDGEGNTVAVIDTFGDSGWANLTKEMYWCCWYDTGVGVLADTTPAGGITGAGDLCIWLLRRSAVRWDRARWRAVADQLNVYPVSGAIEAEVDAWGYLIDRILPWLPISLVAGLDGIYPIVHRLEAEPERAQVRFTLGAPSARSIPGVHLVECLEDFTEGRWTPDHRIRFGWNSRTQEYMREIKVTGDLTQRLATDTFTTLHSVRAAGRHAVTQLGRDIPEAAPETVIEVDAIGDNRGACLVLKWRSALLSAPHRFLRYAAPEEAWDRVELGQEVIVSDAERDFAEASFEVIGKAIEEGGGPAPVVLTLRPFDPHSTARPS